MQLDPLDVADGNRWTALATSDTAPSRLLALLRALRGHNSPAAPARAGHVLMLLGRPGWAVRLLAPLTDPLSTAQCRLARVQLARNTDRLEHLVPVLVAEAGLGRAEDALGREAQARAYLAHGMALDLSGCPQDGAQMLHRALAVASLEGLAFIERTAQNSLLHARHGGPSTGNLERFVHELVHTPYRHLLSHTARDLRARYMAAGQYHRIAEVGAAIAHALPEAAWWAAAARSISLGTRPPALSLAPSDPMMQVAHAYHHLLQAARQRAAIQPDDQQRSAAAVLALPVTEDVYDPHAAELMAVMRLIAQTHTGDLASATRAAGALWDRLCDRSRPLACAYLCAAVLALLAEGGTYPANFPPRMLSDVAAWAYGALHQQGRLDTSLHRVAALLPSALLALSELPGMPPEVRAAPSTGLIAVLSESGLTLAGAELTYIGGEGAAAVRSRLKARPGELAIAVPRTPLHRHRQALKELRVPLASADLAARALSEVARDAPSQAQK